MPPLASPHPCAPVARFRDPTSLDSDPALAPQPWQARLTPGLPRGIPA
jgi:hypothetical protein